MAVSHLLEDLHRAVPLIAPSLLACDFANLGREVRRAEEAGAEILHLDIMDGHFVPNLSFGLPVVEAIRRVTHLPLDVHLMISEPGRYLERFREAGADLLTIHIEAAPEPGPLLGGDPLAWARRPGCRSIRPRPSRPSSPTSISATWCW